MSQETLVKRLRRGWLSSAQAFHEFDTLKLTSRISDLRAAGVRVLSRAVTKNGKKFNEYRIAGR